MSSIFTLALEEPFSVRIEVMTDPKQVLEAGRAILDPLLTKHGFVWVSGVSGSSSGGQFASGQYLRANRRLEIHFRHSLGLVTYHVGPHRVQHAEYMRALLGSAGGNQYPGFSKEPLDAFRHLAHDLRRFCGTFLDGSDEEFECIVAQAVAASKPTGIKRLP